MTIGFSWGLLRALHRHRLSPALVLADDGKRALMACRTPASVYPKALVHVDGLSVRPLIRGEAGVTLRLPRHAGLLRGRWQLVADWTDAVLVDLAGEQRGLFSCRGRGRIVSVDVDPSGEAGLIAWREVGAGGAGRGAGWLRFTLVVGTEVRALSLVVDGRSGLLVEDDVSGVLWASAEAETVQGPLGPKREPKLRPRASGSSREARPAGASGAFALLLEQRGSGSGESGEGEQRVLAFALEARARRARRLAQLPPIAVPKRPWLWVERQQRVVTHEGEVLFAGITSIERAFLAWALNALRNQGVSARHSGLFSLILRESQAELPLESYLCRDFSTPAPYRALCRDAVRLEQQAMVTRRLRSM